MKYLKRFESVDTKINVIKEVMNKIIPETDFNISQYYEFHKLVFYYDRTNMIYDIYKIERFMTTYGYVYYLLGEYYYKDEEVGCGQDFSLNVDSCNEPLSNNIYKYLKNKHPELDYLFSGVDMGLL